MPPPTRQKFESCVAEKYTWKAMDHALYSLCQMKPRDIGVWDITWSGVTTVGLAYKAVIFKGWSLDPIAKALADWALPKWDEWTLRQLKELPAGPGVSLEGIKKSILIHGSFCKELRDELIRRFPGKAPFCPRSLVSKWLHFCGSGVPIFDSKASKVLAALDLTPQAIDLRDLSVPDWDDIALDRTYQKFCERLWAFAESLGKPYVSVKDLDVYLWAQ
ncbi:MAG: hypothetical protein V2A79_06570 [Planctomycetota bacterium]